MSKVRQKVFEYVEPIGARVLVRKDEPKRQTKGGIALPDAAEIPTITGRIVSPAIKVHSETFGEFDLKLSQLRSLHQRGHTGDMTALETSAVRGCDDILLATFASDLD